LEDVADVGIGLLLAPLILALQAQPKPENTAASTTGFVKNLEAFCLLFSGRGVQNVIETPAKYLNAAGLGRSTDGIFTGDHATANNGTIGEPVKARIAIQTFPGGFRAIALPYGEILRPNDSNC
jgi:hypothetical protein